MMINSMDARQLKAYIKKGYTPDEVKARYSCTEEELKFRIGQLYHQGNGDKAREVYRELEANCKKHKKPTKNPQVDSTPKSVSEPAPNNNATPTKTLAELKAKEHSLSGIVIELEGEHKALSQRHHACISRLRDLQLDLSRIKTDLQKCHAEYTQTVNEADEVADQMNAISARRRDQMVALEAVRHEITEKERVSLYVFADGQIEAPDNPDFILDDYGYLELKKELVGREECLDLRLRDITTLARLLKITEKAQSFTLVCEAPELETAFVSIRG